jgi:hypothetical protein
MRHPARAAALCLLALPVAPVLLLAQGEHARPLARGTLRLSFAVDWAHASERFGTATPLRPDLAAGSREPLGTYFSSESLGTRELPFLSGLQDRIRDATGLTGYAVNLGRMLLTLDASVRTTPIRLDVAPSRRWGLGVTVPLVRSRMKTALLGPDTADAATLGNVGWNPAWLQPGAADAFLAEVDTALRALREQALSGPPALRAQAQAEYDALRPWLCGLSAMAAGSAADPTSPCYAATPVPQGLYLPLGSSAAGDSIETRLDRFQQGYAALAAQYAAAGVTLPAFGQDLALPTTALDSNDLRRLYYDPLGPIAADSLTEVVRTRLGDIEIHGWVQLADRPRLRSQLTLLARLPTGTVERADNLVDLGTGDHQTDLEVGLRNDLVLAPQFWLHLGGRYGVQLADRLPRRVSPWYYPSALLASRAETERDLGDYWAVDLVPNWQLDDAIGVAVGWHYYRQGATRFSYTDPSDETRIGLPASILDEGTAVERLHVGAGVTYSTVERHRVGRSRLPIAVTWSWHGTFRGRGGQVPKNAVMTVRVETYWRR